MSVRFLHRWPARSACALLLSAGTVSVCSAADPATRPTTGPATQPAVPSTRPSAQLVQATIARLADPDWHVRTRAAQELIRGGDDAEPIIDAILHATRNPGVRSAAAAARDAIARNRQLGASLITMHLKDVDARTAFEQLSHQAYCDLRPQNDWSDLGSTKGSVDIDHQPFWIAMQKLGETYGVSLNNFGNNQICLTTGGGSLPNMNDTRFVCMHGPFAISVTSLSQSKQINYGTDGESVDSTIQLQVYVEPKIVVLSGGQLTLDTASDNKGNSLLTPNSSQGYYGGSGVVWPIGANLHLPKDGATSISLLKGSVTFVVQTKMKKVEISEVTALNGRIETVGAIPVVLKSCKADKDSYELTLTVPQNLTSSDAFGSLQQSVQDIRLLDASGRELSRNGFNCEGGAVYAMKLTYTKTSDTDGRPTGDAAKLVWKIPEESTKVVVPFEFKNLPVFQP